MIPLTKPAAAARWPDLARAITTLRTGGLDGTFVAFAEDGTHCYGERMAGVFVPGKLPEWPLKRRRHA